MSSCQSKTYPFTPSEAQQICDNIKQAGGPTIDPSQQTGEDVYDGVDLKWSIGNGVITIDIPKKPMLVPCSIIYDKLDKLFGA